MRATSLRSDESDEFAKRRARRVCEATRATREMRKFAKRRDRRGSTPIRSRVVRLLEVRSPVDHRVLDNELKLMSARRPGAYCICNLLRLKTRRLGRFLRKTQSTQNNKLKVLSESDVDSVNFASRASTAQRRAARLTRGRHQTPRQSGFLSTVFSALQKRIAEYTFLLEQSDRRQVNAKS